MKKSIPPLAGVKILLGIVIVAFLLSLIYAPLIHYIPFVYINILLAAAFGYAIGLVGRGLLRGAKLHSFAASVLTGFAGGVAGMFFAWTVYVCVVVGEEYFTVFWDLLSHPSGLLDAMSYFSENPIWSVSRRSKTGASFPSAFYYAVWGAEFLVVVGAAVKVCVEFFRSNRLCDACGGWLAATGDVVRFAVPEGNTAKAAADALHAAFSNGDAAALARFSRLKDEGGEEGKDDDEGEGGIAAASPGQWLEVGTWACHCPESEPYAAITLVTLKENKKKELERDEKTLWRFVRVTKSIPVQYPTK